MSCAAAAAAAGLGEAREHGDGRRLAALLPLIGREVVTRGAVGDGAAIMFLSAFVAEAKASGLVAELLEKWGQAAHLSVAKDE